MSSNVLTIDRITKRFAGRAAVKDLSFTVRKGEVFALLGPNGAGKTTTVRMLAGILRPDEGRIVVTIGGQTAGALPPSQSCYLPEDRGLYPQIPVLRTLTYFGRLRGLERADAETRAIAWLERMGLADRRHERVDALSKGNQQRVQMIAALIHRPALAILDEPFTGLDPVSQEFFLDLVRELKANGTTILLSAHQMDLVERAADRVLLMNRGREILAGSLDELHGRLDARPRVRMEMPPGADTSTFLADEDVEDAIDEGTSVEVILRPDADVPRFVSRALASAPVQRISTETARLHDVFVRAVRDDDARVRRSTERNDA